MQSLKLSSKPGSAEDLRKTILKVLLKHGIKGETLLDIGGGTGEFTVRVARIIGAKEICLVDINDVALKEAEERGIKCLKIDGRRTFYHLEIITST
jgi:ubiquinone/menaquinone biosynthesis C-methylase UbiE